MTSTTQIMFWTDYLIVSVENLCQMLMIDDTMMTSPKLATVPEKSGATVEMFKSWQSSWTAGYHDNRM